MPPTLHLATTPEANAFLAESPLALLVGMELDQQIPMEKAFTSPYVLAQRLEDASGIGCDQQIPMEKAFTSPEALRERLGGTLDAHTIAGYDADALEAIFREPPALHRFPAAMAKRVQALAQALVERYDGDAAAVWTGVTSGDELVRRVAGLPGFGEQKAKIFAALLAKQFDVRPDGWRTATGAYGEQGGFRSVADVVDDASLQKVRSYKQEMKRAAKAATAK